MKFIVYTIALLLVLLTQGRSDDEHWCIATPELLIGSCKVAVRKARVDKKTNRDDHGQTQAFLAANDK
ncbi:hypothetical protein DY000_02044844 [Brassica cretica]|uniref:Pectinesterase inhibitor domain-containing protein n=1 Tax=Brassica cretica TaxID=69181 RepID=A0ABQ7F596_BRACR|nr:hypothetical protein DY000_02044844 [Brassica cretica]